MWWFIPGSLAVSQAAREVVWGYSDGTIGKVLATLGGSISGTLALSYYDPSRDELDDESGRRAHPDCT